MNEPTFRERYLAHPDRHKPRTVKQIRESLGLLETSNVGESLGRLQMDLASEPGGLRLRSRTVQERAHSAVWWVEGGEA